MRDAHPRSVHDPEFSSQSVYALFFKIGNSRRRESLRTIHDACLTLRQDSRARLTVAAVGRKSKPRGGPSAPAMYNRDGQQYRTLIAAHRVEQAAQCGREQAFRVDPWEQVTDPETRARIHHLEEMLRTARRERAQAFAANQASKRARNKDGAR